MKIGFDAKRAFNNHTGLGNYSRMLIEAMFKHHPEHQYSLFTPQHKAEFADWANRLGVHAEVHTPAKRAHRIFHPYWRSYRMAHQMSVEKLDLYHGLSHELPLGLAGKDIAGIVTVHDLIFLRYPKLYPRLDRYFYKRKYERSCHDADHIVAISQQTADDVVDFFGIPEAKISVIYQDCAPVFKQTASIETDAELLKELGIQSGYIFAVGTIETRKNQLKLLEAYAQLPEDRPQLILAGRKTSYWKQLFQFIQKNQLEKEVIALEQLSAVQLAALYRNAVFTAYISVFEGFGLPVLESIACGSPVLAANSSCLEESGGNAALYANPLDAESIAMQMRRLLYDESCYEEVKNACAEQAARFSEKSMANELNALYLRYKV
ncbi:MAG: glycosyltransferase family 4 protein [Bacteroidia bacterium]